MERKFTFKVPGGKLLKVSVDSEGGIIKSVKINGDFFAHPEDGIERLEAKLAGKRIEEVDLAIAGFIEKNNVKLYGISPADIAFAVREALK